MSDFPNKDTNRTSFSDIQRPLKQGVDQALAAGRNLQQKSSRLRLLNLSTPQRTLHHRRAIGFRRKSATKKASAPIILVISPTRCIARQANSTLIFRSPRNIFAKQPRKSKRCRTPFERATSMISSGARSLSQESSQRHSLAWPYWPDLELSAS